MRNALLPILLLLFSITSCTKAKHDQTFRFVLTSEPPSLDWSLATDHVSADILVNIMEGLVIFDNNLKPQPAMAEKWDVSPDGKTYTFHIRKNIKWNDGKPLTAHDFYYSWQRLLDPKTAAEYAYFLFDVKNAQEFNSGKLKDFSKVGLKVVDNYTFQVELSHPASYFINVPTFWVTFPMRKDIVEKFGPNWTDPQNIVTAGPFILSDWKHDAKVTLTRNPTYYGTPAIPEKIEALIINEDITAISLFETDKVQLIRRIPPLELQRFKNKPEYINAPYLRGYYYGFNVNKPPFDNPKVRQAFSYAIDRKQIVSILKGGQIPATSWVPKGMFGFEPGVGIGFDSKKARSLLAEAGYPDGKGLPKITLYFDSRDDNRLVAEKVQSLWKEHLGIEVTLENAEWKVYLKQLQTDTPQVWRLGWGADYPDPHNFLELFTSYSGNNNTHWKNQTYDTLINEGAKEFDRNKREEIYRDAQILLTEKDVPMMPLFYEAQNILLKPYVKGFQPNAMNILILKNVEMDS
ncbi:MAG: oligopeptide-binding protein oppA [Deltaproteobacteria bacterium RIFCSPHIGHO2_12_FULL_43_9]|nr:MAG: oligopeptide-binding protein oppA [Deltaproteobacteria bacterium RIFCSPHIGHO2_12_FULL_43_9]